MQQNNHNGEERRKRERLHTDLPVRLTIVEEAIEALGLKFYGGRVVNMSQDGIAIEVFVSPGIEALKDKQRVTMEITLPDNISTITVAGEATWGTVVDNPFHESPVLRVGLKIRHISSEDAKKLKAHLDRIY